MAGLVVVTPPASDPITLAEAKLFARVSTSADDTLITGLITAARRYAEPILDRTFVTTIYDLTMDAFPLGSGAILFPRSPLTAVGSVKYIDSEGVEQTWDAGEYDIDTASLVGRLVPAFSEVYPPTRVDINAVTVRFTAGNGALSEQREDIKLLVKILVAESYEKRLLTGDTRIFVNDLADSLMWSLRILKAA